MRRGEKARYLEICLGYYDGIGNPKLVNPFQTGDRFPALTEVHEATHRELAEANTTDALARYFAVVLHLGQEVLPSNITREVQSLLETIHRCSDLVHETIATYLSCWVFHSLLPGRVEELVSCLPDFYKSAYQAAVRTFGSLDEADQKPYAEYVPPIVLGVGLAALNIDYSDLAINLSDLDPFAQRMTTDQPNRRFCAIANVLNPPSEPGILRDLVFWAAQEGLAAREKEALLSPDQPYAPIQLALFEQLRRVCPEVEFVHDRAAARQWIHSVDQSIRQQIEGLGFDFMDRLEMRPMDEETEAVEARLSSSFVFPELPEHFPLDVTLVRSDYRQKDRRHLLEVLGFCRDHEVRLHAFLAPPLPKNEAADPSVGGAADVCVLACLAEARNEAIQSLPEIMGGEVNLAPFFVLLDLDDLDQLVPHLRTCDIGIKTDERFFPSIEDEVRRWNLPTFVLLRDTSHTHILQLVSSLLETDIVLLATFRVSQEGRALAFRRRRDSIHYCVPITENTQVFLKSRFGDDERVVPLSDQQEATEYGFDMSLTYSILRGSYGVSR
jgi:hypothetical protein